MAIAASTRRARPDVFGLKYEDSAKRVDSEIKQAAGDRLSNV
jgi:hypothetical protein